MADGLKLSHNDRAFLKQLRIDSEDTELPQEVVISVSEALEIMSKYGDLTIENWARNRGLLS